MDFQKEREAFEAWHYEQYLLENPNIDISNAKYIYDYAHKNALVCQLKESHFTVWQAAKAKADQKIKLLLCDEHLKKCESPTGVFNSQYPDEEPCLICLAKQAKAVPAQLDVNSILHDIDCYFDNGLSNTERTANNLLQSIYEKLSGEVKAQEPAND